MPGIFSKKREISGGYGTEHRRRVGFFGENKAHNACWTPKQAVVASTNKWTWGFHSAQSPRRNTQRDRVLIHDCSIATRGSQRRNPPPQQEHKRRAQRRLISLYLVYSLHMETKTYSRQDWARSKRGRRCTWGLCTTRYTAAAHLLLT